MMLNALAGLMMIPNPATTKHPFTDLLLAGGPKTHADGSVTWNPPARYDKPFDGRETIKRLPQSEVVEACRRLFADAGLDVKVTSTQKGCAVFKGKDGTIIVIDKPFMGVTPEAAIRHERGHLNGWKQDHPD
jgi:hypothetical protein